MVTIRLTRRGATNTPFYHVVVTDSRKRQGGKSLEQVGFFNPESGEERDQAQARHRAHRLLALEGRAAVRSREESRDDVPQGERLISLIADLSEEGVVDKPRHVEVGRLGAAHGVRGWLRVQSYTDPPQRLFEWRELAIAVRQRLHP